MRFSAVVFICLLQAALLAACATSQQAPVIDRAPGSAAAKIPAASAAKNGIAEKDWRPAVHTVKKGDTLHSIGLEYGYDYKEVAQKNNIAPPYIIHIGQQLRLPVEAKTDAASGATIGPANSPSMEEKGASDNGVVITPLKTEPGVIGSGAVQPGTAQPGTAQPGTVQPGTVQPGATQPKTAAGGPTLLSEPKALREPYSEQAMTTPKPVKTADAAKIANQPKVTEPAGKDAAKPVAASGEVTATDWAWPANGKILAGFNDTSAKGIDIAGTQGQAVNASAAGKVIYVGSDLRGYGKLVIIKHDKDYLSVYAHNSQIAVKEGQQVSKGQKIAEMGSTDSDRVKLHFEIRRQGKSVDPAKLLPAN
jgi:lipoprotein NlpD